MKARERWALRGKYLSMCLILVGSTVVGQANANDMTSLQSQWDMATFELNADARETALHSLAEQARAVCEDDPENVDLLIWKGIIVSSLAGEKGGLGALRLAKEAKAAFEQALQSDPMALNGSAYASLGTLYHQVPGWPIGFGSDKKARVHLDKALAIDPAGIVNNFFMAEFMRDEGEYEKSKQYLLKALAAPERPGRKAADIGRRQAAEQLLALVEAKLD
jgi:tetratricopeptide (TPR) repeat protein